MTAGYILYICVYMDWPPARLFLFPPPTWAPLEVSNARPVLVRVLQARSLGGHPSHSHAPPKRRECQHFRSLIQTGPGSSTGKDRASGCLASQESHRPSSPEDVGDPTCICPTDRGAVFLSPSPLPLSVSVCVCLSLPPGPGIAIPLHMRRNAHRRR